MDRKYKDSTLPDVSPLDSNLSMQILTSSFHHFTERVQGLSPSQYGGCDPRLVTEWVRIRIPSAIEGGTYPCDMRSRIRLRESCPEAFKLRYN
ncbi:hypothetical protein TNCV_17661 [Trichonephila clavipes]|nr:hypothetical protein TNCV_17661 [Trichonephila clavipes]